MSEQELITKCTTTTTTKKKFIAHLKWPDLFLFIFLHLGTIYGVYLIIVSIKFYTFLFLIPLIIISGLGITAGVHRLWSHRSYKAKLPLKIILMIFFTITAQRDIISWCTDHRIHHKYSDTDSDPHNANRGFLYAHIGWLVLTPHPQVIEKRQTIDVNDLRNDSVVQFNRKYYILIFLLFAVIIPLYVANAYWNESLWNALWVIVITRITIILHIAFLVNSWAHFYGNKPYDKYMKPVESLPVSLLAFGEGWHNYHHVFPWDYKASELGGKYNPSTLFINLFARIGWAYDLKSVTGDMLQRRIARTGNTSSSSSSDFILYE